MVAKISSQMTLVTRKVNRILHCYKELDSSSLNISRRQDPGEGFTRVWEEESKCLGHRLIGVGRKGVCDSGKIKVQLKMRTISNDTAKGRNKEITIFPQDILPQLIKPLPLPETSHQEMYLFYSKILLLSSSEILKMVWSDGYTYPQDREDRSLWK